MYHGNEIKNIWSIAMLKFKNRKQVKLYEDNSWLTKKQHERLSGSVYHTFREFILPDISVKLVSKFFSERHGRPTKDIQSMIGLFILQHTFDMSDDQTIEAYTYNDAFRYALDISRNEYLAVRTYYYYRSIILGKGKRIFENILKTILEKFEFSHNIQRIDSTVVQTWLKNMNRLEMFSETIRLFLIQLKTKNEDIFKEIPESVREKYLPDNDDDCWFGKYRPSQYDQALISTAKDILAIISQFKEHPCVSQLNAFALLQRIVKEQVHVEGEQITIKLRDEYKGSALVNPHDPDAQYNGHKKKAGYKVNSVESCSESKDVDNPNIILEAQVLPANKADCNTLEATIDNLEQKGLKPEKMLADNGYDSQENESKLHDRGVELIAPPTGDVPDGFAVMDFETDEATHEIKKCPMGQKCKENIVSEEAKKTKSCFDPLKCQQCPHADDCPVIIGKRTANLTWEWDRIRMEARRFQFQDDPDLKDLFKQRSGGESTFGCLKAHMGLDRVTRRGFDKVQLVVFLMLTGLNILRIHRWRVKQGGVASKLRSSVPKNGFFARFMAQNRFLACLMAFFVRISGAWREDGLCS